MRQAIVTKYFGPTNSKGSRIQAKCAAKTIYVHYMSELNPDQMHEFAAKELQKKLGWDKYGALIGGGMPDGSGYCFVLIEKAA